jgi:hypothetical protein
MGRHNGIYLAVSEIISRRDNAWNLSGGCKNTSTTTGRNDHTEQAIVILNCTTNRPLPEETMKIRLLSALAGLAISFALPCIAWDKNMVDPQARQEIEALLVKGDEAYK